MNIWEHIKLAGAVVCIIAALLNDLALNLLGLFVAAIGVMGHVTNLEQRMKLLESKGDEDNEDQA